MTTLQLQSLRRLLLSLMRVGVEMLGIVEDELQARGALRERTAARSIHSVEYQQR